MPWSLSKLIKPKSKDASPKLETATYTYTPLSLSPPCIRLAIISPGPPSSLISVTLLPVPLFTSPSPNYEALSYTWGPPTPKRTILLHNLTIPATPSLETALKRLRYSDRERTVWIDALCINQQDVEEKTSQVRMMRDIYERAARVVVWLGPSDADSFLCINFLQSIAAMTFATRQTEEEWLVGFMNDPSNDGTWHSLFNFTRREYWRRMWIVQEIVTASSIIVYCGLDEISWDELLRFMYLVYNNPGALAKHKRPEMTTRFLNVCDGLLPANLNNMKNATSRHGALWVNLSFFRWYKSTDPRDKLFAILGISDIEEESREDLCSRIDYKLSFKDVSIESVKLCAKYAYQGYGPLTAICLSTPWGGENRRELPSWVPDWTYWPDMMPLQSIYHSHLQNSTFASNHYDTTMQIHIQGDTLIAQGLHISTLKEVSPSSIGADIGTLESWDQMIPGRHHTYLILRAYETFFSWAKLAFGSNLQSMADEERLDAFWRTLCCNRALSSSNLPDFRTQCGKWLQRGSTKAIMQFWEHDMAAAGGEEKAWEQSFLRHARGRKFAISERGHFCLVTRNARLGDVVCVLAGCDFPVVLRRMGKGNGEKGWMLVGETYLHGYMEGRAMGEASEGVLVPMEFRIS